MTITRHYGYSAKLNRLGRNWPQYAFDFGRALGLLGLVFSVAALMVYATTVLLTSPALAVRGIEIRGLNELTEKDIYDLTGLRLSQNLLTVNLPGVIRKIQTNPWVKEVSVSRMLPDRLKIEILERKSLALLKKENTFFLIDESGLAFKELAERDQVDLPVITGWTEKVGEITGLSLQKMVEVAVLYHERMEHNSLGSLSEVHVNEIRGITLFTDRGLSLYLGYDDYELKLTRFKKIWQDLTQKGLGKGFMCIDLSDPDKANVEWRDIGPPKLQVTKKRGLNI